MVPSSKPLFPGGTSLFGIWRDEDGVFLRSVTFQVVHSLVVGSIAFCGKSAKGWSNQNVSE